MKGFIIAVAVVMGTMFGSVNNAEAISPVATHVATTSLRMTAMNSASSSRHAEADSVKVGEAKPNAKAVVLMIGSVIFVMLIPIVAISSIRFDI